MRYNNKRNFQKKDKYNKELGGMTVSVRQVKNKDGETVSDVNGALRVLKKRMMKDGFFQTLRERSHFTCLLYTSPSPRDDELSRMPSSA